MNIQVNHILLQEKYLVKQLIYKNSSITNKTLKYSAALQIAAINDIETAV